MLSKNVATMPFGVGAIAVYTRNNQLIHLFINQIHSL
jgi:hypothetical protein